MGTEFQFLQLLDPVLGPPTPNCDCVHSLLDVLDLHAGRAAAAGAHERLSSQLWDLSTSCLRHTNTDIKA